MASRLSHAALSWAGFIFLSATYSALTATPVDLFHVAVWSAAGIVSYIGLSFLFGFDPHRTRLTHLASGWMHYLDRWELRQGQATLSMLGCMVLGASWLDSEHFVLAVVSGTLSAWTYFAWRLHAGGYHRKVRAASY